MFFPFNRWRRLSNILGILFSCLSVAFFVASLVFFGLKGWNLWSYAFLFTSLILNYSITFWLSIEWLRSQYREDLFINFFLFIFLIFPYVGVFFYFLLGFDSIHKDHGDRYTDLYLRYKRYEISPDHKNVDIKEKDPKAFIYNFTKHKTPIYSDTEIIILSNASKILQNLISIILRAKDFIHLEFYIFSDGLVFEYIFNLLRKKIKEGVEVRLIYDYFGSKGRLSRKSVRRLKKIGVQVRVFNPFYKSNNLWWQFRNHNKVVVVDNKYAFIGSCNVADEYFNITNKFFQTTELAAQLTGSIVNSVSALFLTHWDLSNNKKHRNKPEFGEEKCKFFFKKNESNSNNETIAQFIDNAPISSEFIIMNNLMQLVFSAKKSIVISTPYFYPPKELVNALKLARSIGVHVKILVPKNPDLINFFRTLNRQPFSSLLEYGVEIYEYFGFNHEKLMIIDDEVVYFGSYNWDYRSLYLNFENALLVRCRKVTETISRFMENQFKNSHRISSYDLRRTRNPSLFVLFIRLFKPFL